MNNLTPEQKARVKELLALGANISTDERDELQTLLADQPPVPVPIPDDW